jgi:hypothetical protein
VIAKPLQSKGGFWIDCCSADPQNTNEKSEDAITDFAVLVRTSVMGVNAGARVMRSTNATLSILSTVELAFELSNDKGSSGKVHLRASEIDSLIAMLAQHRATMAPEVPRSLPELEDDGMIRDPIWILHAPGSTKDKLLLIRHPGLGWLMFQLPPSEAAKLGHALLPTGPQQVADRLLPNGPLH